MSDHLRHHRSSEHLAPVFGADAFGRIAERIARLLGTPRYIIGQTLVVMVWILLNITAVVNHWDPYPFILLNLAFSTQAAYAAPLILLAQTRQADRDKALARADAEHREELQAQIVALIKADTDLTKAVHERICRRHDEPSGTTTDDPTGW